LRASVDRALATNGVTKLAGLILPSMQLSQDSFKSIPYGAIALAAFLSFHGLRRGSLSPSGAFGAFTIASIMMAVPLRVFGVACIVMYLVGSRATKFGKELKGKLEADHTIGGYRNIWQVYCVSCFKACSRP
jgi:uncharacterized membrane protein